MYYGMDDRYDILGPVDLLCHVVQCIFNGPALIVCGRVSRLVYALGELLHTIIVEPERQAIDVSGG